jgi:hypothetical protein
VGHKQWLWSTKEEQKIGKSQTKENWSQSEAQAATTKQERHAGRAEYAWPDGEWIWEELLGSTTKRRANTKRLTSSEGAEKECRQVP